MKNRLIVIFITLSLAACATQHNITGRFDGLTNDTIFIESRNLQKTGSATDNQMRKDTVIALNGRFSSNIPVEQAKEFVIYPMQLTKRGGPSGYCAHMRFFLDKGEQVKIKGRTDSIALDCTLSGTRLNEDLSTHYQELLPYWTEAQRLQDAMKGKSRKEQESLLNRFEEVMQQRRACEMAYINANPNNPLAGYCLRQIPVDSVVVYYERLGEAARNSVFRPIIDKQLQLAEKYKMQTLAKEQIIPGKAAPDFTLEAADGSKFTLSSLRGKYVVLDFWGSWCGWCIKGFPELKACYAKSKGKLEVVGIACRDSQEKWLAAIREHALPWINVINPEETMPAENIAVRYGISAYPTKIVINPDGDIVDIFVGAKSEFAETMDRLLK